MPPKPKPELWGGIEISLKPTTYAFWGIMERLRKEFKNNRGFWGNRALLLEAYVNGTFYGVRTKRVLARRFQMNYDSYHLPCFIVVSKSGNIDFIWVAPEYRRLGLGSFMVKECGVRDTPTNIVTPEGRAFFKVMQTKGTLKRLRDEDSSDWDEDTDEE